NALLSFSELYKEGMLLVEKLEKSWN
ncbi:ArpU family phage packaging/lysis transcriptional regulator, partial [Streptococcus pyogenes]